MADIILTDTHLRIDLGLKEKIFALHGSVEVPLEHVIGVEIDPKGCGGGIEGNERFVGLNTDGVTFGVRHVEQGPTLFCAVREGQNVVGIDLQDEDYKQLLVEVERPAAEVADEIMRAVEQARQRNLT